MTMRRSGNGILMGGGTLLAGVLTFGVVLGMSLGRVGSAIDVSLPDESVEASSPKQASAGEGTVTDLTSAATPNASLIPLLSPEVLSLAVDRAPFQEDRQRPMMAYRLPGDVDPTPRSEAPPPPPAPEFQLVGTVSGTNGGWAIVRVGEGAPQMIAIGERIEGYTLSNVRGERAVMASADRSLSLTVIGPSPEVQTRNRNQGRVSTTVRSVELQYTRAQPAETTIVRGTDGEITIIRDVEQSAQPASGGTRRF